MNTATTKTTSRAGPGTPSVQDRADRARTQARKSSRLFMPLRLLRRGLVSAAGRAGARVGRALSRAAARVVRWVRARITSPVRSIKALFMATIGKDRGFGFWWLVATAAIALAIGLLVAVLLSPVIGIVAALVVGIWMLVSRSRSQTREIA